MRGACSAGTGPFFMGDFSRTFGVFSYRKISPMCYNGREAVVYGAISGGIVQMTRTGDNVAGERHSAADFREGGGMNTRQKTLTFCAAFFMLAYVVYNYYMKHYSNDGILHNVITRSGYTLALRQEPVPVELLVKPEWIANDPDERKEPKIALLERDNTTIVLDNVWNRGSDIYFSFHTTFKMSRDNGSFLYNGLFRENGSFSTAPVEVLLFDLDRNPIPVGQIGTGPGADFSFGVDPKYKERIRDGFYVSYTGFNLYNYAKS